MHKWLIYKTTCLENNKIYIGQHKTTIIEDGYLGSGKLLKRALDKYGKCMFKRDILFIVDNIEDANRLEEQMIESHDSTDREIGYNITKHAWGGQPITEESRKKISEKMTGRKLSEETKEKMRKPKTYEITKEHKENMSKSRKGKSWYHNPETNEAKTFHLDDIPENWVKGRGSNYKNRSRTHSEEEKKRRSEVMKDRYKDPLEKQMQSERAKGSTHSDETKKKISESLKKKLRSS
jgi:group I intron endonuclease